MGIHYRFEEQKIQEAHGSQAIAGSNDFSSKKEMKRAVKRLFKTYQCPNCGGHRTDGNSVVVKIGKVKLFKEKIKKGIFGKKYVHKRVGDLWRVYDIYLESSGFLSILSPSGYIRCKSCNWQQKGGKGVRWLSVNDVMEGNF